MSVPPTFGLLVPCRNGAATLPRLFDSVRAQTRRFDEIWLFDDGSTDGSGAVAERGGARVLRSEQSVGPAAARNRLIAACGCPWLHFHDADDTMDPRYLERVAQAATESVDAVICDMLWLDEATGQVDNRWRYDAAELARDPVAYLLRNTIGGINGLYRRERLAAIGGFDAALRYWEDLDLGVRLARSGARIEVVNEDLVTAYRHGASYSNANLGEVWRSKLRLMDSWLPTVGAPTRAAIAAEAETIADRQARLGLWSDVPLALATARRAGANPPTTRNGLLRLLKLVLPDTVVFRLQFRVRRRANP